MNLTLSWKSILFILFSYIRCFLILFVLLKIGNAIVYLLHIPIPGSILALLFLFLLLALNIIPVDWIKLGCNLIMKYMSILFIPASMGIMDTYPDVLKDCLPIFGGVIGSTVILFIFIAVLSEKLKRRLG